MGSVVRSLYQVVVRYRERKREKMKTTLFCLLFLGCVLIATAVPKPEEDDSISLEINWGWLKKIGSKVKEAAQEFKEKVGKALGPELCKIKCKLYEKKIINNYGRCQCA